MTVKTLEVHDYSREETDRDEDFLKWRVCVKMSGNAVACKVVVDGELVKARLGENGDGS
jgi:hypothetical protein